MGSQDLTPRSTRKVEGYMPDMPQRIPHIPLQPLGIKIHDNKGREIKQLPKSWGAIKYNNLQGVESWETPNWAKCSVGGGHRSPEGINPALLVISNIFVEFRKAGFSVRFLSSLLKRCVPPAEQSVRVNSPAVKPWRRQFYQAINRPKSAWARIMESTHSVTLQ